MTSIEFYCDNKRCNEYLKQYSGCPDCADNYCQLCASRFDMICPCGGELQQGKYFQVGGCCKLPVEVVQHKSLKARINALNKARLKYNLIEAEYREYKRIIVLCERQARVDQTEVQDNLGYYKLLPATKGYLNCYEATDLILFYAVPGNVEQLLGLVSDEYFMKEIRKEIDSGPKTEAEWKEQEESAKDGQMISINSDATIIPDDCNLKCFQSYRDSIELLRKHLNRE